MSSIGMNTAQATLNSETAARNVLRIQDNLFSIESLEMAIDESNSVDPSMLSDVIADVERNKDNIS